MPFVTLSNSALQRIPHLEGAPSYVHFVDTFGTPKASETQNPLTGSLFYIESTDDDQELRPYNYDETGVVLKGLPHLLWPQLDILEPPIRTLIDQGTLVLEDETGKTATLQKGDTFFIHRGSEMRSTTPKFGISFKGASRWKNVTKL